MLASHYILNLEENKTRTKNVQAYFKLEKHN